MFALFFKVLFRLKENSSYDISFKDLIYLERVRERARDCEWEEGRRGRERERQIDFMLSADGAQLWALSQDTEIRT